jgi:hypothetical protein
MLRSNYIASGLRVGLIQVVLFWRFAIHQALNLGSIFIDYVLKVPVFSAALYDWKISACKLGGWTLLSFQLPFQFFDG